ncbi:MAG TPA: hypothetical protein VK308_02675, partial [Pyrinomonadaceae bacterium]|nr:hypothetical protein [Pyrinomonadaceae bacterium]
MKSDEKTSKKLSAALFLFCSIGIVILSAPLLIAAQTGLQKTIDRYIEKVREDAEENREARKI